MSALAVSVVVGLATLHAPHVDAKTMAAFAQVESGLDPLAVHDNTTGQSYAPKSIVEGARIVSSLTMAGHDFDAGLLGINGRNFRRLGLAMAEALDPVLSIKAGARIMVENYRACLKTRKGEAALRCMASYYNAGHPTGDDRYVTRLWTIADQLAPAIPDAPVSRQDDGFADAIAVHAAPVSQSQKEP